MTNPNPFSPEHPIEAAYRAACREHVSIGGRDYSGLSKDSALLRMFFAYGMKAFADRVNAAADGKDEEGARTL